MIIAGVLELASKIRYGVTSRGVPMYLFVPYNKDIPSLIVASSERDLSRNQIAVVDGGCDLKHLDRASLHSLLGPVGSHIAEVKGLLAHYAGVHGIRNTLKAIAPDSPDSVFEIDETRIEISKETGWTVFTVDPAGCMDADDAIAFNPSERMMAITIADVASVVAPGSPIDMRAREIGATFYDLDGRVVVPMLPKEISEGTASLLKGQRRRGLTLLVYILDDGPGERSGTSREAGERSGGHQFIARTSFQPSWITVEQSFTYESFAASSLYPTIQEQCPEEYKGIEDTHKWIEALMVLYNREAAAVLKRVGAGILRVQKKEREEDEALGAIDFRLITEVGCYVAVIPGEEQEHATLGCVYCHASSPLRRYVDLVNQRILLGGSPSHEIAALNERAKNNKRWNRDLQFLTFVTPGVVHTLEVVSLGEGQKVWVPTWGRRLTLRHEVTPVTPLGARFTIQIFCDPTKRCWKERILTAPTSAYEKPAPCSE